MFRTFLCCLIKVQDTRRNIANKLLASEMLLFDFAFEHLLDFVTAVERKPSFGKSDGAVITDEMRMKGSEPVPTAVPQRRFSAIILIII